jgi:hypothetical protein
VLTRRAEENSGKAVVDKNLRTVKRAHFGREYALMFLSHLRQFVQEIPTSIVCAVIVADYDSSESSDRVEGFRDTY